MRIFKQSGAFLLLFLVALGQLGAHAQWNPTNPVISSEKKTNGVEIHQKGGMLRIEVDAPEVLHVTCSPIEPSEFHPTDGVVVRREWPAASFDTTSDEKTVIVSTARLKVVIERESGSMHFEDAAGKQLTTEAYRSLKPVEVNGERAFHAESFFAIYGSHEALYGLGQHQAGV